MSKYLDNLSKTNVSSKFAFEIIIGHQIMLIYVQ